MPKTTEKPAGIDVLVLGDHPSAYFAAALLAKTGDLKVAHVELETGQTDDRQVTINPALFKLHPLLAKLGRKLEMTPIYGIRFLADESGTAGEYRGKSIAIGVVPYRSVRDQMLAITRGEEVDMLGDKPVTLGRADETGIEVLIGRRTVKPKVLVVAGKLSVDQQKQLGLPVQWDREVPHRFTSARSGSLAKLNLPGKVLMPMSVDLCNRQCWGWLLPGDSGFQLAVEQPVIKCTSPSAGIDLLKHWVNVLKKHQVLAAGFELSSTVTTVDLPLAGALESEGVGNRCVLIGPAGGFYSSCGEEIYPSCWSALFAADALRKALREKHLQDALDLYRHNWRTTLGDYLRGPRQNLRFLLSLVYRNPAMSQRLGEAILFSKSIVR